MALKPHRGHSHPYATIGLLHVVLGDRRLDEYVDCELAIAQVMPIAATAAR